MYCRLNVSGFSGAAEVLHDKSCWIIELQRQAAPLNNPHFVVAAAKATAQEEWLQINRITDVEKLQENRGEKH